VLRLLDRLDPQQEPGRGSSSAAWVARRS
jgi:hypothetical protein